MIKLTKGNEPAVLTANKTAWKNELRGLQNANQVVPHSVATRYNHDQVKDALRVECYSKCMYCESKVEHISYLHIEHIKPKAKNKFPEANGQLKKYRFKPKNGKLTAKLNNISYGEFAIAIYQDNNNNGEIDKNFIGIAIVLAIDSG